MKKHIIIGLSLLALVSLPLFVPKASAQTQEDLIRDAQCTGGDNSKCVSPEPDPGYFSECSNDNCNIVNKYLNPFINLLTIMVGLAVVIGIIIGGIQYAGSAGDPQKVAAAKLRIRNSIVALIVFFFLYALLHFLIPGRGLLVD